MARVTCQQCGGHGYGDVIVVRNNDGTMTYRYRGWCTACGGYGTVLADEHEPIDVVFTPGAEVR